MTLLPGERAANPAHKFLQPDFSTLWWWEQAWNSLSLEWFAAGDDKAVLKKQGFLSAYHRVNPGDATGKSLPPVEWLVEYYLRIGDMQYRHGEGTLHPTAFKSIPDSPVSEALRFVDYFVDSVRKSPSHGFDYETSSRIALLLRAVRFTEADWRYLYGLIEALQSTGGDAPEGTRAKYLLSEIARAVSANLHIREITGEGILLPPTGWLMSYARNTLTPDGALATGVSNFPEVVRNPSTSEEELKEFHQLIRNLPASRDRPSEMVKQALRWVEAHPNWTSAATPVFSVAEPGEDKEYFIGYDAEMLHPTLCGDVTSELTPRSMRLKGEGLSRSLSDAEGDAYFENDPALWSGTRMIAGYHALTNFSEGELNPLLMDSLAKTGDAIEAVAGAIMPAFGALLAELVEPYSDEDGIQVPLEWILEISSE